MKQMRHNNNGVINSILQSTYVTACVLFLVIVSSSMGLIFTGSFGTSPSNGTSDTNTNTNTKNVSMVSSGDEGYLYIPNAIQVKVGDTVTWTNDDDTLHTVTSGSGADENMGTTFNSGMMAKGKTFEHTFRTAGEYPYFCMVHPDMVGKVLVS
jgi:plastocyanin